MIKMNLIKSKVKGPLMQPDPLPSSYQPYILNDKISGEMGKLRKRLDAIFKASNALSTENGFVPFGGKEHIVTHPELPGWIIKGGKNDHHSLPDNHICRADITFKIKEVIRRKGFKELVLPKKYLYKAGDKWYVIAEKLEFDPSVTSDRDDVSMQEPKVYKPLTKNQAKELATLCFEGRLEDVSVHNINFLKNGQIAIVDTEPLSRKIIKTLESVSFSQLRPSLRSTFRLISSLSNSEILYLLCEDNARKEVRKVQRLYFWKHLAKLLLILFVPLLAALGFFMETVEASAPFRYLSDILLGVAVVNVCSVLYNGYLSVREYRYIGSAQNHADLAKAKKQ